MVLRAGVKVGFGVESPVGWGKDRNIDVEEMMANGNGVGVGVGDSVDGMRTYNVVNLVAQAQMKMGGV